MKEVADADALAHAIGRVARKGAGYATNFFATRTDINKWLASRALLVLEQQHAVLILRRDADFHRLYHVASGAAALSAALGALVSALPAVTIVTDLIGKKESLQAVADAHAENAFAGYTRLLRMYRLPDPTMDVWRVDPDVMQAGPGDVQRIHMFLQKQLDPVSEQIPDLDQLNDAVAKGAVLAMYQASELAGVLIHDTTGYTTTLRYWHIDGRFRDQGIGARLIRMFFSRCAGSRRILLWVIASNEDAIAKYRHYGFRDDSLVDDIMVRHARPMQ